MKEIIVVILAVAQIPVGLFGATVPSNKSRVPPIMSGLASIAILLLLIGYYYNQISEDLLLILSIIFAIIPVVIIAIYIFVGNKNKKEQNSKYNSLSKDDKKYITNVNQALQDINDYYKDLADGIDKSKISKSKIEKIDKGFMQVMGLKEITFSKSPTIKEKLVGIFFFMFDVTRLTYVYYHAYCDNDFRAKLYLQLSDVPDSLGIGLFVYDTQGKQLYRKLSRLVGERITSGHTITEISNCQKYCYAANNLYYYSLLYKKGHPNYRINYRMYIKRMSEISNQLALYAFANVNNAITNEFLGLHN